MGKKGKQIGGERKNVPGKLVQAVIKQSLGTDLTLTLHIAQGTMPHYVCRVPASRLSFIPCPQPAWLNAQIPPRLESYSREESQKQEKAMIHCSLASSESASIPQATIHTICVNAKVQWPLPPPPQPPYVSGHIHTGGYLQLSLWGAQQCSLC